MSGLKLTREQEGICESKAPVIKVTAFAGTGKTSTLKAFSDVNTDARILYVAFNKAIQLEAASKFPAHVTCKTAHSLAYGVFGREYGNLHDKLRGDIRPFHILRELSASLRDIPAGAHNLYGGRVIETVKNFLVSADPEMGRKHVSIGQAPVETKNFDERRILADAQKIWGLMQDKKSPVPMLHDGYLKQYQLAGRKLSYDIILFDEAQDTNPVTQAIVGAQQHARKIYVGDRHQAIYGFRGATNAMELIDAAEHHYLTGSFRFGEAVADVANTILAIKNEGARLRGLGGTSTLRAIGDHEGFAFISRGNVAIFNRAVQCLSKNQPFSFVGDIKGYRFDQILDVYNLSAGRQVKDPFIASFAGFDELAEYAEVISDREVKSRCRVVTKYGSDIPRLIEQIEKRALPPVVSGDEVHGDDKRIVMTTGHKSKGLEFANVKLAGDFMDLLDEEGRLLDVSQASDEQIEEINIQYVAVTRAQRSLHLCDTLEAYLEHVQDLAVKANSRLTA